MSMLYSIIKIKIDISNDELLETIWEHMNEIKRGGVGEKVKDIIKLNIPCANTIMICVKVYKKN